MATVRRSWTARLRLRQTGQDSEAAPPCGSHLPSHGLEATSDPLASTVPSRFVCYDLSIPPWVSSRTASFVPIEPELTAAADALRKRKAAVSRLLRRVGAVARPTPVTPPATASPPQSARPESPKKSPPKTPKKSPSTPTSNPGKGGKADGEDEEKEQGLGSPKKGKKKKKKKKKATLANEGNPHHIDKCMSTSPRRARASSNQS